MQARTTFPFTSISQAPQLPPMHPVGMLIPAALAAFSQSSPMTTSVSRPLGQCTGMLAISSTADQGLYVLRRHWPGAPAAGFGAHHGAFARCSEVRVLCAHAGNSASGDARVRCLAGRGDRCRRCRLLRLIASTSQGHCRCTAALMWNRQRFHRGATQNHPAVLVLASGPAPFAA